MLWAVGFLIFMCEKQKNYVLKRGKAVSGHKNHKEKGYPSVTYAAPVIINGDKINVAVAVLFSDKDRPHSLRVLMPSGEEYVMKK